MKVISHIRNNQTLEIRKFENEQPDLSHYIWSDGNFSCDCNREIFFERESDVEIEEKCSDGRFSVNLEAPNGDIFYKEF